MMRLTSILILLLYLPLLHASERSDRRIEALLAAAQPPDGVVFEIMAWRDRSWDWAAPQLRVYVDRLRRVYPDLDIALVSNGAELFDLTRDAGLRDSPALRELAAIAAERVSVHVAGDYASWKRLDAGDFPEFVDVAASGSAQLADYVELGFVHIQLEEPHAPG